MLELSQFFCDIEKENWCLDPKSVEKNITKKTKAIIVVDLHGNMGNMTALSAIAKKYKIPLIEDSAQALGSIYKGKKAGSFGIGSVFSFHRSKTIATGEGGMLLLDNKKLFDRCMMLRDHGRKPHGILYYNYEVTPKYIPSNLQAALGSSQFQRIDKLINKKRWILESYKKGLSGIPDIALNPEPEGGRNGVWVTGLVIGKSYKMGKLEAMSKLAKLGVPPRPFFYPLSSLPAFGSQGKKYAKINPVAYDICSRGINLPCSDNLDKEQINFICQAVQKMLGVYK
jgi:perosamine synthetase